MNTGYYCNILADSIGPHGHRLTTFEVRFPRMVLADITRHRALSFSVESTRAIPLEDKVLEDGSVRPGRITTVAAEPYVPVFRRKASGMGGGEELSPEEQHSAQFRWVRAAHAACQSARKLQHTSKEHAGRLLEPFAFVTAIISGTDWNNFFELRCPPIGEKPDPKYPAQYELQVIAEMMREQRASNKAKALEPGEWHLPLVFSGDRSLTWPVLQQRFENGNDMDRFFAHVGAGRCAAVSYLNHGKAAEGREGPGDSAGRWEQRLAPNKHWSPGEHPAVCMEEDGRFGNFHGFKQLRKFYPGESGE